MRIAVLGHNLRMAGGLSVGKNIVASLKRVADHHDYLLFLPGGVGYEQTDQPTNSTAIYCSRAFGKFSQWAFENIHALRAVRQFRADVVWGLGNFGLRNPCAKQAILLQNAHYVYPIREQSYEVLPLRVQLWIGCRRLNRSLAATQIVFCQTRTMAKRFVDMYGYGGSVKILPNAVSRFVGVDAESRLPAIFDQLRGKFVLFCLTKYYPHKNLEILVELFRRHHDELRDIVVILTVRPDHHPKAPAFVKSLSEQKVREHFINLGPVDQKELAGLFRNSQAMILPTLLESFSGTYLEAMQFGCPILTSDVDFAREICGDAASFFDPKKTEEIRDAILRLRDDTMYAAVLASKGNARVQSMFRSWDEIVTDAVAAMEELA